MAGFINQKLNLSDFRLHQKDRRLPELFRHELQVALVDPEREADDARAKGRLPRSQGVERRNSDLKEVTFVFKSGLLKKAVL